MRVEPVYHSELLAQEMLCKETRINKRDGKQLAKKNCTSAPKRLPDGLRSPLNKAIRKKLFFACWELMRTWPIRKLRKKRGVMQN
jgi:hypothetical protein